MSPTHRKASANPRGVRKNAQRTLAPAETGAPESTKSQVFVNDRHDDGGA